MKKSEKTALTVTKIRNAAIVEFGTNGYAGGTINNISKSGINKGLIYNNFKSKDTLYLYCLKMCCRQLVEYSKMQDCSDDLTAYLHVRMRFFNEYPNEAHILFEALLNPQQHLQTEIHQAMQEFDEWNERVCRNTIQSLTLRDGVTLEDALFYFRQIQTMFNGYFSSPSYRNTNLEEKVRMHENNIPKLLDFILYGIAKGDQKK